MTKILTAKGAECLVDDDVFEWARFFEWRLTSGYFFVENAGRTVLLHRVVIGAEPGQEVDHVDANRLNNTRENLRICSRAENMMNRHCFRGGHSGFKGVTFHKRLGKWAAQITSKNKNKWLGSFDDEAEAARAYDAAARELFGSFARLNFPAHGEQHAIR